MSVRRRSKLFAYVLSLFVLGGAVWGPSTLLAQAIPGSPFGSAIGGAFSGGTVATPILFPSGTAGAPSIAWSADADGSGTGLFRPGTNQLSVSLNGVEMASFRGSELRLGTSTLAFGTLSSTDGRLRRLGAGTMTSTDATVTSIGSLLGGGATVASADPLPVPTGIVFHVSGTTNFTNITETNMIAGACFTMIFDGILTITDGGNLFLSANYTTSAADTLTLCFDGADYYETDRSVN